MLNALSSSRGLQETITLRFNYIMLCRDEHEKWLFLQNVINEIMKIRF